jgi:hypothetical protein
VLMLGALSVEPDQDPTATRHWWILQLRKDYERHSSNQSGF